MMDAAECSLCGGAVGEVPLPADWPGITSDNRPWKTPGPLTSCSRCGHVQKAATAAWRADVARVYAEYALYHLSAGVEQVLFCADVVETKSARILDRFAAECGVAAEGTLLDVGCGQGSLLRAFAVRHPAWRLHGHEQDARARVAVLAQPGVEGFHTGAIGSIGRRFDLVTIVHVFEHVFEPLSLLREVGSTLAPGGRVVIQVPDTEQNPFDLMVVDHRSHFFTTHLLAAAYTAGYAVELAATDWIAKEITLVLTPAATAVRGTGRVTPDPAVARRVVARSLEWLQAFVALVRQLGTAPGGVAIFGTANAATWLASIPGVNVRFFVDEDPNKIGRTHLGHPILAPADVPSGVPVLLAFPSAQAITVRTRLAARAPQPDWRVV
jgi:SAM-dependent methyltransferase